MRNPNRLDSLYDTLHYIHKTVYPDLRFGQMMSNFFAWCVFSKRCSDIFYVEDDSFEKWIKEYANEISNYKIY